MNEERISLFDPAALRSFEFSGYDMTMAIAELIDNSIDANATEITMVSVQEPTRVVKRRKDAIYKFAILDNGDGMNSDVLQFALTIGGTTHPLSSTKKSIGKFGMGLPQASLNMAHTVNVWSWKNNVSSVKHAYIDRGEDDLGPGINVPDDVPIPDEYINFVKQYKSGTIVEWSDLIDTGFSRRPEKVFLDIEKKIGRMYRYFLHNDKCKIRLIPLDKGKFDESSIYNFKPLDPLFLMEDGMNGCVNDKLPVCSPMFEKYGKTEVNSYELETPDGIVKGDIKISCSVAKKEIWPGDVENPKYPGDFEYGILAGENIGVSVVRADRELEFIDTWFTKEDSRNRWWGVEISFDPVFDSVFGVDNRKQSAKYLRKYATKSSDELCKIYEIKGKVASGEINGNLRNEDQNLYILMKTILRVNKLINTFFPDIEKARVDECERKGKKKRYSNVPSNNKEKYDSMAEKRNEGGKISNTDKSLENNPDRITAVEKELKNDVNLTDDEKEIIRDDVKGNHRCSVIYTDLDSSALFGVERKASHMILKLNRNHPMYPKIFGMYESIIDGTLSEKDPTVYLETAFDAVVLMMEGWVRMEDEALTPEEKETLRNIRENWGRILIEAERYGKNN